MRPHKDDGEESITSVIAMVGGNHGKLSVYCAEQVGSALTLKLSRAAAGREAHGKLFLPCGLRPDEVSA